MRTEVKIGLLVCVIGVGLIAGYLMIFPGSDEVASKPDVPPLVRPTIAEPQETAVPVVHGISIGASAPEPSAASEATAPTTPPAPADTPVVAAPQRAEANQPLVIAGESAPDAVPTPPPAGAASPRLTGGIRLATSTNAMPAPTANRPARGTIALGVSTRHTSRTYTVRAGDNGFWAISRRPEVYGAGRYEYLIRKANPGVNTRRLRPGMTLVVPPLPAQPTSVVLAATRTDAPPPRAAGSTVHVVREGDDYWTLAAKYLGNGSRFELIRRANPGVNPDALQIGQKITIPKASVAGAATIAKRPAPPAIVAGSGQTVHTIASGDVLSTIARARYGNGNLWPAIVKANPGLDPDKLKVGRKIVLPSKAEAERQAGIVRRANTAVLGGSARASVSPSGGYVPGKPLFD